MAKLSAVPDGWSVKSLEETIDHLIDFRGRTPKKLGMAWGGGNIRALSANNVQMGFVNFDKECYLASDDLYQKWMTKGDTEKDDVLFTMEAPLGNVALVPDDKKYIMSQRVILMKADKNWITPQFFYQQLRGDYVQQQLIENSTGSTAVGIQQKKLVKLELVLPPLPEQQKIAAILSSVDNVIEQTQAQIDKLKDLKTGMMQELLTKGVCDENGNPHTEFKDSAVGRIPAGWDVVKFEHAAIKIQDGTHFSPQSKSGECLYLTSKNIQNGKLDLKNISYISQDEHDGIYKRCDVQFGDVLLTKDGANTGNCAMNTLHQPFSLLSSVAFLRCDTNQCINEFMYHYILSPRFQRVIQDSMTGNAITRLTLTLIKNMHIGLPSIKEQKKIVGSLSSIDNNIETRNMKLNSLINTKKALMQDLLTGKVRVTINNKEKVVA